MPNLRQRLVSRAILLIAAAAPLAAQGPLLTRAVDQSRLDTTCSPCQDFYRFANGAWLDTLRIPPHQQSWGPRRELQQRNRVFIADMLDSLAYAPERHARDATERKVGTFYRACMDTSSMGSGALRALKPELDRISAIHNSAELGAVVGRLSRHGAKVVFNVAQGYDAGERIGVVVFAFWNAFSFPYLNQYLANDSTSARVRDAFVAALTQVFEGVGDPADTAAANARRVLSFQTALRRIRLVDSGVTWLSLAQVRIEGPAFGWDSFVRELGRPDLPLLGVRPRGMVRAIDSLVKVRPLAEWKAYLRWRFVFGVAPELEQFQGAIGKFFRVATGRQQTLPRRERCGVQTTGLGGGVARAYVARAFSPEARTAAIEMVEGMRAVLRERIAALDWLGPESRDRAVAKLNQMRLWIGYPDRLDDLSGLDVRDGDAVWNQLAARRYATDRQMALVGTRLDRDRWIEANPAFAEGHYYPQNALLITAAQLQPPFFDRRAEPAAQYGKIGQVIGHELTHAFDDGGRLYNELGQRVDWWTPVEVQAFTKRAELIVRQYDEYIIVDSIRQSGRATLSDNIADIGGITLAWLAFERAMQGRSRTIIDGFTPEQRFFIAYAQGINTEVERRELYRTQAQANQYSHSAPKWRVNGPLAHLPAFAAAFGCKQGDPMVRPTSQRWTVW